MKKAAVVLFLGTMFIWACQPDRFVDTPVNGHMATPLAFPQPNFFPTPNLPIDNPLTVEGVELGKHLFYETRLSGDNSLACAGCHLQDQGFADFLPTSEGIDGISGTKNAMPIFNLAWQDHFFWDGRRNSLEEQAHDPVVDPIEMHTTWEESLAKLEQDSLYQYLFTAAFGANSFTEDNATKAIAQFERTMVSANSKFDRWLAGTYQFTTLEAVGFDLFNSEQGDCFHCHGAASTGNLFGAYGTLQFSNNGLDSVLVPGSGREGVTGDSLDRAKFKIPSLRNVEYTYPYMHDGRFQNLFEVIEFYNMGGHDSYTIDPNMKAVNVGRNWSQQQKDALMAFLLTLSDPAFITDSTFASPF